MEREGKKKSAENEKNQATLPGVICTMLDS